MDCPLPRGPEITDDVLKAAQGRFPGAGRGVPPAVPGGFKEARQVPHGSGRRSRLREGAFEFLDRGERLPFKRLLVRENLAQLLVVSYDDFLQVFPEFNGAFRLEALVRDRFRQGRFFIILQDKPDQQRAGDSRDDQGRCP
jgi:hypothetical protein